MKIAILAITDQGRRTAETIHASIEGTSIVVPERGIKASITELWKEFDCIICVMATGIVVRCIAELCSSKFIDPAIVVVDEQCRFAISLLSGHIGGANSVAQLLERHCGLQAVITTGSDVSGKTSVDLWAIENNLAISNPENLAAVSTRLLNHGALSIYQDGDFINRFPVDLKRTAEIANADIVISIHHHVSEASLHLVPRILHIGFGCRRGASIHEFQEVLDDIVVGGDISLKAIAGIASVDLKNDEEGLLALAEKYQWPVKFFTKEQINGMYPAGKENKVYQKVGVYGVAEPAARLAAAEGEIPGRLIIGKKKWERITAAIAAKASSTL